MQINMKIFIHVYVYICICINSNLLLIIITTLLIIIYIKTFLPYHDIHQTRLTIMSQIFLSNNKCDLRWDKIYKK